MVTRRAPLGLAACVLLAAAGLAGPAQAEQEQEQAQEQQDEGRLLVELNRLENVEQGCRGAVVFTNDLDMTISELAIEVAVFDHDDQVKNLWLLPARNLTPGKIRVRQFLFQEESCDDIGRVLLNDVVNCENEDGLEPEQCLARVDVTSRTDVPFVSTAGDGR